MFLFYYGLGINEIDIESGESLYLEFYKTIDDDFYVKPFLKKVDGKERPIKFNKMHYNSDNFSYTLDLF